MKYSQNDINDTKVVQTDSIVSCNNEYLWQNQN